MLLRQRCWCAVGSLKDATSLLMSAGFERPGAARGGGKTGGTIESLDERDKY